jgi:hypothetical protein
LISDIHTPDAIKKQAEELWDSMKFGNIHPARVGEARTLIILATILERLENLEAMMKRRGLS